MVSWYQTHVFSPERICDTERCLHPHYQATPLLYQDCTGLQHQHLQTFAAWKEGTR